MRCKDYISGAEFRVMFDSEDTRNEWYSSINDKKSTEIQKLVKQSKFNVNQWIYIYY